MWGACTPSLLLPFLFVQALALEQTAGNPPGIPEEYRERIAEIAAGDTYADGLGRAMLMSRLHYFFALDAEWAAEVLLPLLDWGVSAAAARQAWDGFLLASGRLSPAVVDALIPLDESAFPHLEEMDELRQQFAKHLGVAAMLATESPLEAGWLARFLQVASPTDIVTWTHSLGHLLRQMSNDAGIAAWQTWLADYWRTRCEGVPRQISREEGQAFRSWIPELPEALGEVVDLACRMPLAGADGPFYARFEESDLAAEQPVTSARLLLHLLKGEARQFWACRDASAIARTAIASAAIAEVDEVAIKSQLLRLGCGEMPNDSAEPET